MLFLSEVHAGSKRATELRALVGSQFQLQQPVLGEIGPNVTRD